ncbi:MULTISPECIES: hypothetical protein [Enterobacterales]|uniref:hypothetical protein n=2 Tax=Gammaproteobacteria TaxID=1236 RepID=UPI0004D1A46B|nr:MULTISPECIES: hypothetical protein [Enterobacteriaceae]AIE72457.1 hypothetical protein HR38_29745 [Klebsiella michiganensis]AOV15586.1 hypothetical protein BJF97_31610 [Klebsiella sp. LTGPAF-6F]EKV5130871.1 hypothetical protein [Citrobacter freundii]MBD0906620.1 hypothetical protein [Klebsiella grimontii]MCQ3846293.1 hypothetical protein [Klebsiella pneumoniae]
MFLSWMVVAIISFFFFRRWEATYQNPLLCALLWPLVLAFFLLSMIYMAAKYNLALYKNKVLHKESPSATSPVSIEKKDEVTIKAHELLGVDLTDKTVAQKNALCEHLIILSRSLLFSEFAALGVYAGPERYDSTLDSLNIKLNEKFILINNLVLIKDELDRRKTIEGKVSPEDFDPLLEHNENLDVFDLHHIYP